MQETTAEHFPSSAISPGLSSTVPVRVYGLLGHAGFMTAMVDRDALHKDALIEHEMQRYRIVSVLKVREGEICVNVVPETYNL